MNTSDCMVCSMRAACEEESLYLYAPTRILFARVESLLQQHGVGFSSHNHSFTLTNRSDRHRTLQTLRAGLSRPEAEDLRVTFDLVNLMSANSLTRALYRNDTRWFEDAIRHERFIHWFQPIVDVPQGRLAGHECLIRCPKTDQPGEFFNGQEIIDAAISRGDLHIFDSHSRRAAIANAAKQHHRGKVFINFTPSSIYDPAFCMASTLQAMEGTHLQPADIVFEVVESEHVSDSRHLRKIVDFYREKGFAVALDDVGTGSNSLQMMSEIKPDFIKLDKSIVWNFETKIGLGIIRKLAEIGAESNMRVIAEGIETEAMRDEMLACGISLMQGYLIGKPAPAMATLYQ